MTETLKTSQAGGQSFTIQLGASKLENLLKIFETFIKLKILRDIRCSLPNSRHILGFYDHRIVGNKFEIFQGSSPRNDSVM